MKVYKMNWNYTVHLYKEVPIHKVTRNDYCVYSEIDGRITCVIDATTLAKAKEEVDRLLDGSKIEVVEV